MKTAEVFQISNPEYGLNTNSNTRVWYVLENVTESDVGKWGFIVDGNVAGKFNTQSEADVALRSTKRERGQRLDVKLKTVFNEGDIVTLIKSLESTPAAATFEECIDEEGFFSVGSLEYGTTALIVDSKCEKQVLYVKIAFGDIVGWIPARVVRRA